MQDLVDAADVEAFIGQSFDDTFDMSAVVGLAGNFELNFFEAVGNECLVMFEFDNVGVGIGEDLRYFEQLAWFVREHNGKAEDTATGDKGFVDQGCNGRDIDIAAGDDRCYFFVFEFQFVQSSEGEYAGAFSNEFVALDQCEQGRHDLHFGDGDYFVKVFLAEGIGKLARSFYCTAVGNGVNVAQGGNFSFVEGGLHTRCTFRLDADDFDFRIYCFGCQGYAAGKSTATNRYEDSIDIFAIVDDLFGTGTLAEQDLNVVERMDINITVFFSQFL